MNPTESKETKAKKKRRSSDQFRILAIQRANNPFKL